jgi:hypothetical protein
LAVAQIKARRQVRDKLPSWFANAELIFPSGLAAEQCSSEQTARYKRRLIAPGDCLCDLTGGLGVDSLAFSRRARRVIYIERQESYCRAARHNFRVWGADGAIEVWPGDAAGLLDKLPPTDVFYVDPSRRGEGNRRVFALQDCEPNLERLLPSLLERAPKVIAKVSPMADISHTLERLPGVEAVHVLSVRNDCKELLFVAGRSAAAGQALPVTCINYTAEGREEAFAFDLRQEKLLEPAYASGVGRYLYEPNVSILKAGGFKSVATPGVSKLHRHSHLYTSDALDGAFPGRVFCVEEVLAFGNALCKTLAKAVPQANITARNFPLTADELRRKTGIKDGGAVYLFATALPGAKRVLIKCRKISPPASGK